MMMTSLLGFCVCVCVCFRFSPPSLAWNEAMEQGDIYIYDLLRISQILSIARFHWQGHCLWYIYTLIRWGYRRTLLFYVFIADFFSRNWKTKKRNQLLLEWLLVSAIILVNQRLIYSMILCTIALLLLLLLATHVPNFLLVPHLSIYARPIASTREPMCMNLLYIIIAKQRERERRLGRYIHIIRMCNPPRWSR